MDFLLSDRSVASTRPAASAGPLLALILAGLLTEVVHHDEAYAGIDYGLSLLALLGATGCIACMTLRLSLGPLPWASAVVPTTRPAASLVGSPARGESWPLLVALLFGPLAVLLAGLGGWV